MNLTEIHNDAAEFIRRSDRNYLLLSGQAAANACLSAADAGLSIGRIEGGQWLAPGFEARLDSIWDTGRTASSEAEARVWNLAAATFVYQQMEKSPDPSMPPANAFILTAREFGSSGIGTAGERGPR